MRAGPGWHRAPPRWDARAARFGHEAELSLRITFRPAQTEDRDSVSPQASSAGERIHRHRSIYERKRYAKEPLAAHRLSASCSMRTRYIVCRAAARIERRPCGLEIPPVSSRNENLASCFGLPAQARFCAEESAQAVQAEPISGNFLPLPLIGWERIVDDSAAILIAIESATEDVANSPSAQEGSHVYSTGPHCLRGRCVGGSSGPIDPH